MAERDDEPTKEQLETANNELWREVQRKVTRCGEMVRERDQAIMMMSKQVLRLAELRVAALTAARQMEAAGMEKEAAALLAACAQNED